MCGFDSCYSWLLLKRHFWQKQVKKSKFIYGKSVNPILLKPSKKPSKKSYTTYKIQTKLNLRNTYTSYLKSNNLVKFLDMLKKTQNLAFKKKLSFLLKMSVVRHKMVGGGERSTRLCFDKTFQSFNNSSIIYFKFKVRSG